jgi:hypothetical protein
MNDGCVDGGLLNPSSRNDFNFDALYGSSFNNRGLTVPTTNNEERRKTG